MDGEDYEQTLLVKKECFIYRIPPRPSASGYKAQDWDPSSFIWTGRLVIVARGEFCTIRFEDPNNGEIFAQCPFDQNSVEPVIDSSRYFVIKIKDGDRHAFVGMGFTDRDDAFEFNATLQDHQNYIRNKKDIEIQRKNYENEPKKDYSLKTGQVIHIPFKAPPAKNPAQNSNHSNKNAPVFTSVGGNSGGGFLLSPPPPASSKTIARPPTSVQQPPQQQQNNNNSNSFSNDFFSSPPQQQQQQQQNNNNNNNNFFGNEPFNFSSNQNNNSFNNNNNNNFNNNNNNFFSSPPPQQQQQQNNNNNQFWFN